MKQRIPEKKMMMLKMTTFDVFKEIPFLNRFNKWVESKDLSSHFSTPPTPCLPTIYPINSHILAMILTECTGEMDAIFL